MIGFVIHANAAVVSLFDNYTLGFQTSAGNTISGSNTGVSGLSYQEVGQIFTPSQTAKLSEIDAPFGYVQGTNSITLSLYTDNSGNPGTQLEQWSITGLQAFSTGSTTMVVTSNITPQLNAGSDYWLVAAPGASNTWAAWNLTQNSITGYEINSNPNNPNWITKSGTSSAFAVYGTPVQNQNVPEPGILSTLLGIGTAGGGMFLRKFRKA